MMQYWQPCSFCALSAFFACPLSPVGWCVWARRGERERERARARARKKIFLLLRTHLMHVYNYICMWKREKCIRLFENVTILQQEDEEEEKNSLVLLGIRIGRMMWWLLFSLSLCSARVCWVCPFDIAFMPWDLNKNKQTNIEPSLSRGCFLRAYFSPSPRDGEEVNEILPWKTSLSSHSTFVELKTHTEYVRCKTERVRMILFSRTCQQAFHLLSCCDWSMQTPRGIFTT